MNLTCVECAEEAFRLKLLMYTNPKCMCEGTGDAARAAYNLRRELDYKNSELKEVRAELGDAQAVIRNLKSGLGETAKNLERMTDLCEDLADQVHSARSIVSDARSDIKDLTMMQADSMKAIDEFRDICLRLDGSHIHAGDCLSECGHTIADQEIEQCDCNCDTDLGAELNSLLVRTDRQ